MSNDEAGSPGPLSTIVGGDISIPPHFERNFWKAVGRLGTSISNALSGIVDRWEAEKKAETDARVRIIEASATQAVKGLDVSPEYIREASDTFMARIVRKQINADTIVHRTAEHIRNTEIGGMSEDAGDISDDFLEHFGDEAGKQNSDWMRDLFARILAGEIRRPGSYSIKLIRTLSELDREVAMDFQKLCSICIALEIEGSLYDVRAPTFGSNPAGNALSDYGLPFGKLVNLEEYGLIISDHNSFLYYEDSVVYDARPYLFPVIYQNKRWKFIGKTTDKNHKLKIDGVALSRIGRELFSVVDQIASPEYTSALNQFLHQRNVKMVRY